MFVHCYLYIQKDRFFGKVKSHVIDCGNLVCLFSLSNSERIAATFITQFPSECIRRCKIVDKPNLTKKQPIFSVFSYIKNNQNTHTHTPSCAQTFILTEDEMCSQSHLFTTDFLIMQAAHTEKDQRSPCPSKLLLRLSNL